MGSCATLATDRGEGTVKCTGCTLSPAGAGSPLIYSTGTITVSKTTGTANGAKMEVVEGKNTAIVQESSSLKCSGVENRNNVDDCAYFYINQCLEILMSEQVHLHAQILLLKLNLRVQCIFPLLCFLLLTLILK